MRRKQRSWISAFASGLSWAMFGATLAYGYHLAIAPPQSGALADPGFVEALPDFLGGMRVLASGDDGAASRESNATKRAITPPLDLTQHRADVTVATVLARSIQMELVRLGCLAGTADGTWSEQTQRAMQRFIEHVHVTLPTRAPEYTHLTLLQGSPDRSCDKPSRSEPRLEASVRRTIVKARPVAVMPIETPSTSGRAASASARPDPRAIRGDWRTVVTASTTTLGEFRATKATSIVTPNLPMAIPRPSLSSDFVGRMAVGVLAPQDAATTTAAGQGTGAPHGHLGVPRGQGSTNTKREAAPRTVRDATRKPSREPRAASQDRAARHAKRPLRAASGSRVQNAFTALNRSAP